MLIKKWTADIKKNTAGMDRTAKAEYIAEYYWYHILIAFLAVGAVALVIYNATFGRRTVSFECAIVNTDTDDARDGSLESAFADALGLPEKEVRVDSAYQVSYKGDGISDTANAVDYSGYDKFFFGWSNGEIDAAVVPQSLLEYCEELGGGLDAVDDTGTVSIPLAATSLSESIGDRADDPMVIIFPENGKHKKAAAAFVTYLLGGAS